MAKTEPKLEELIPLEFAKLKPANESALRAMDTVCQLYDEVDDGLQRNIRVEQAEAKPEYRYDDGDDDFVPDDRVFMPKFTGHWPVSFDFDEKGNIPLNWTFGSGVPRLGKTRGITHLLSFPGEDPHGVAGQHLRVYVDEQTGILRMVALSENRPVTILIDTGRKTLLKGEKWSLGKVTRFELGDQQYVLVINDLDSVGRANYTRVRNSALQNAKLPLPDPRFQPIPNDQLLQKVGSTTLHQLVGKGSRGVVYLGASDATGSPCAVKQVVINKHKALQELEAEFLIDINHSDQPRLMQASEICDSQGRSWKPGQLRELEADLQKVLYPYILSIVMPLAITDLFQYYHQHTGGPLIFAEIVEVWGTILEGLAALHAAGYMHRNVINLNCFVIWRNGRLVGLLGHFGKAVHAATHFTNNNGPSYSHAPEIDGQRFYTNKIDIFAAGIAILQLIYPEVCERWGYNRNGPQTIHWIRECIQYLDEHMVDSMLHIDVIPLLQQMIDPNPDKRPTAATLVKSWPNPRPKRKLTTAPISAKRRKINDREGTIRSKAIAPTMPPRIASDTGTHVENRSPTTTKRSDLPRKKVAQEDPNLNVRTTVQAAVLRQCNAQVAVKTDSASTIKANVGNEVAPPRPIPMDEKTLQARREAGKAEMARIYAEKAAAQKIEDEKKAADALKQVKSRRIAELNLKKVDAEMREAREKARQADAAYKKRKDQQAGAAQEAKNAEKAKKFEAAASSSLDDLFEGGDDLFEDNF